MNIEKRITNSILNTVIRAIINFCTALLLARLLGPEDFGRFSFLAATFIALKQFLDMASSEAFFKYVCERPRSKKFLQIFSAWIVLQLTIVVVFIGLLFPESLIKRLWAGEHELVILLAFMAMFFRETVWSNVVNLSESYRLTTYNQSMQTVVVVCHLFILGSLWLFGSLVIEFVFLASVLEWIFASIWLARIIKKHKISEATILAQKSSLKVDTVKSVFSEFWTYCKFLIPYAWVGFIVDFYSRWMLQNWGSAQQQAYFAVSQQVSAISILMLSSLLKIFWKEISESYYHNDLKRMEMLYIKSSYFFYFIAATGAGLLLPWTDEIINILLGAAYTKASLTMKLMFIYPVHQTLGILTGTILYATGHIKLHVTLGLIFYAVALSSGFYLMAPDYVWKYGLDLGSEGLAIRFVLVNVIFVNVWAFMICRLFKWEFKFLYQFIVLSLTIICGYVSKAIINLFTQELIFISISSYLILYIGIIAFIVYVFPTVTGFTKNEILEFFYKVNIRNTKPNPNKNYIDKGL